ncbi:MAG: hypothetical protein L3J01_01735 [Thiomicrorhabdus sp.]|nr:hypothetical protein [Thiomicrorhabdus sp.]
MLLSNESLQESCLCGSKQPYHTCCFPFHNGDSAPETAEQLMRSRYVAYAKKLAPYLLQTWCSTERPEQIEFDQAIMWTGLIINDKKKGRKKDREGWVVFTAFYQDLFKSHSLREKSFFSRDEKGHWYYVKGDLG